MPSQFSGGQSCAPAASFRLSRRGIVCLAALACLASPLVMARSSVYPELRMDPPKLTKQMRKGPYVNAHGQIHGTLAVVEFVSTKSGRTFPLFHDKNNDKSLHLGGANGNTYAIRIRNLTPSRILAVVSVDGVNVVSGEAASAAQGGYVLAPYGSVNIDGWRKSLSEVAEFVFSPPGQSYASKTGRAANVGVIGAAIFTEEPLIQVPMPAELLGRSPSADSSAMESAPSSSMKSQSAPGLGTAHGDRKGSAVTQTTFKRAQSTPNEVFSAAYDTLDNLERQGIAVRRPVNPSPNPFPADGGFVADPPRY